MFGSVRLFVCVSVCVCVRVFTSRGAQNGWAFKMVVVSTGCELAVHHAFNLQCGEPCKQSLQVRCLIGHQNQIGLYSKGTCKGGTFPEG